MTLTGKRKKRSEGSEEAPVRFENTLHESILDGMRNVLGEGGMQAALFHLQLVQYARNPREFHQNLETIFRSGATTLEKIIVKEMCRKLGLPYREMESFDFAKYCELAKQILMARNTVIER